MLCFIVLKRSMNMQLNLAFPETLEPHAKLWATLDEEAQHAVIERLAELIESAVHAPSNAEGDANERQ